jgi:hypothetical protein
MENLLPPFFSFRDLTKAGAEWASGLIYDISFYRSFFFLLKENIPEAPANPVNVRMSADYPNFFHILR